MTMPIGLTMPIIFIDEVPLSLSETLTTDPDAHAGLSERQINVDPRRAGMWCFVNFIVLFLVAVGVKPTYRSRLSLFGA